MRVPEHVRESLPFDLDTIAALLPLLHTSYKHGNAMHDAATLGVMLAQEYGFSREVPNGAFTYAFLHPSSGWVVKYSARVDDPDLEGEGQAAVFDAVEEVTPGLLAATYHVGNGVLLQEFAPPEDWYMAPDQFNAVRNTAENLGIGDVHGANVGRSPRDGRACVIDFSTAFTYGTAAARLAAVEAERTRRWEARQAENQARWAREEAERRERDRLALEEIYTMLTCNDGGAE